MAKKHALDLLPVCWTGRLAPAPESKDHGQGIPHLSSTFAK